MDEEREGNRGSNTNEGSIGTRVGERKKHQVEKMERKKKARHREPVQPDIRSDGAASDKK